MHHVLRGILGAALLRVRHHVIVIHLGHFSFA